MLTRVFVQIRHAPQGPLWGSEYIRAKGASIVVRVIGSQTIGENKFSQFKKQGLFLQTLRGFQSSFAKTNVFGMSTCGCSECALIGGKTMRDDFDFDQNTGQLKMQRMTVNHIHEEFLWILRHLYMDLGDLSPFKEWGLVAETTKRLNLTSNEMKPAIDPESREYQLYLKKETILLSIYYEAVIIAVFAARHLSRENVYERAAKFLNDDQKRVAEDKQFQAADIKEYFESVRFDSDNFMHSVYEKIHKKYHRLNSSAKRTSLKGN